MNERYVIEDDDNGDPDWQERSCERCEIQNPFSFGFDQDACEVCTDIAELVPVSDSYIKFFYDSACVGDLDPEETEGDGGSTINNNPIDNVVDPGAGEVTKDEEIVEEKENFGIFIVIAIIIVFIGLFVFLFYKFYLVPKRYQ